jgi:hypothetical protein
MEPINKQERSIAFGKFLGIYLLIVAIPLLAFYFFLTIPDGAVRKENDRLKAFIEEQNKLLERVDKIALQAKELEAKDIDYRKLSDEEEKGRLKTQIQENTRNIQSLVIDIKRDSASLLEGVNKRISKDVINSFDALLTYRNTIESLRSQLERDGNYSKELENKENDIAGLKNQINTLTILLATKGNNTSGGGGGGGDNGSTKKLEQLNRELAVCQERLTACQNKPGVPITNNSNNNNEENMADLRLQLQIAKADCNKQLGDEVKDSKQRRRYYNLALLGYKDVYQVAKKESVKGDIKSKIDEVEKKAKKISSGDF